MLFLVNKPYFRSTKNNKDLISYVLSPKIPVKLYFSREISVTRNAGHYFHQVMFISLFICITDNLKLHME